ncbi:MAG: substrate-binding domain-containing protein [bacterium]|nr:substrate-binding domain-containing protein [bacterium]
MKGKRCMSVILALLLIVSLTACGKNEIAREEKVEEDEDKLQIGMTFDSFVIERWQRDRDVFVAAAKELGAEVNVQNANGEVDEQIAQIEYFIDRKVDVIVIISIDGEKLFSTVAKAKKAGIKVIAYDRPIKYADSDLYISFDNEAVGRMMGEVLCSKLPADSKIIMISGPMADSNVPMVNAGFENVVKRNKNEIIDITYAEGWRAEEAYNYINDHVTTVSEADAIMCGNDNLAGQAIKALSERRLAGKVLVVGQDAELEACQRIVEGTQLMTVYKPVEKLAREAAEYAVKLAKGEDIGVEETYTEGAYEIPCVTLEPIKVTAGNMDEVVINSGFHLREDVYMNVTE